MNNYQLTIFDEDGKIKSVQSFKSILQMSKSVNVPYHNLKKLFDHQDGSKYKNSKISKLAKYIKIKYTDNIITNIE